MFSIKTLSLWFVVLMTRRVHMCRPRGWQLSTTSTRMKVMALRGHQTSRTSTQGKPLSLIASVIASE